MIRGLGTGTHDAQPRARSGLVLGEVSEQVFAGSAGHAQRRGGDARAGLWPDAAVAVYPVRPGGDTRSMVCGMK